MREEEGARDGGTGARNWCAIGWGVGMRCAGRASHEGVVHGARYAVRRDGVGFGARKCYCEAQGGVSSRAWTRDGHAIGGVLGHFLAFHIFLYHNIQ